MPVGEIRLFAGPFAPIGWEFCQGQTMNIPEYAELYVSIRNKFGGDGARTFALPDLRGRAPMHAGNGVNFGDKPTLAIDAPQPQQSVGAKLHVNHIIRVRRDRFLDEGDAFISEIRIFAGPHATKDWLPCDGRTVRIFDHTALFSLLGARFSERDDSQLFNLPNLNGRMPVHPRTQDELGAVGKALAYNDAAPRKTNLALSYYIAADGVFPGRP